MEESIGQRMARLLREKQNPARKSFQDEEVGDDENAGYNEEYDEGVDDTNDNGLGAAGQASRTSRNDV
jgi:hypothetical protein